MNDPESQFAGSNPSAIEELQEDLQSLKTLFAVALVVLIVFSICINLIIFKQVSTLNTETQAAAQMFENARGQTLLLWNDLYAFGRQHPDFNTVLDKYSPFVAQLAASRTNTPPAKK